MEALHEYDIEFIKLKIGVHQFVYSVDKDFFKHYEVSSVKEGNLKVNLEFRKETTMFDLRFDMRGTIKTECDRCLDVFDLPVATTFNLLVKITDRDIEDEEAIVYIPSSAYKLNVAQHIYDMVHLAIPIKKTCDLVSKDCNQDTVKLIAGAAEEEENRSDTEVDPRWEELKNLFDKQ